MPTLRTLVLDGAARLSTSPHPDRARQDAEALLLSLLKKDKAWLMAHAETVLAENQASGYAQMLDRRSRGEPIQYIMGETEFYSLPFRVTPDVLIPRPETEHLVEKVIAMARNMGAPSFPRLLRKGWEGQRPAEPRILDIGTGSGCIAIALAHHIADGDITAIDVSASALDLARQNAALNGVEGRIRFLQGDLLASVEGESFEIVVSNPPYVPMHDRAGLSVEVRDHEPALALFAGPDGLDVYRRLIPAAHSVVIPGGFLAMEIGYGQSEPIAALLAAAGFEQVEFVPDLQGIPRVACARR